MAKSYVVYATCNDQDNNEVFTEMIYVGSSESIALDLWKTQCEDVKGDLTTVNVTFQAWESGGSIASERKDFFPVEEDEDEEDDES